MFVAKGVADRDGGPTLQEGDQRVCANYRGITLLSLPGKSVGREGQADHLTEAEQCEFRPQGPWWRPESMPIQSTYALWTWRSHSQFSGMFGRCCWSAA